MMLEREIPGKQKGVTVKIENAIKLDPQNPIPIQYGGDIFYTGTNKKYVPFIGKQDNLPNLLLEARLISSTQNTCIQTIAKSTIGKGLIVLNTDNPDKDFVKWMTSVNNSNQSFAKLLLQAVEGERSTGNQFVEIKRGSIGNTKFVKVYLHSPLYCRLSEPNDDDICEAVLISKLFARKGFRKIDLERTKQIPLWDKNALDKTSVWKKNDDGTESTMLHFKNEISGIDYYGLPASIAGLRYQVLEGKSAQYNIDNFENNMVLGGMLIFKSAMTQEEAERNAKEILISHVGEGKSGRIAVISSESGLQDVDWKPYETQKEGSYIELDKRIEEKIISANEWDALLAGIQRSSTLGNGSGYIRAIWDIKESSLLNPLREKVIDEIIKPIFEIYADWYGKKEILGYEIQFKSSMPYSFMADINPNDFMKVNEARKLANLEADDSKEDVYLSELKAKNNVQAQSAATKGADNNG